MKHSILFGAFCAAVLTTATFVACNSTDEPIAERAINPVTVPTSGFDGFMASVDSLNNVYSLQSRSNAVVSADGGDFSPIDTRLTRDKMVSYADKAGTCAGIAVGVGFTIAASGASGGTLSTIAAVFGIAAPTWYSHYYSAITKLATISWGYKVSSPKLNSVSSIKYPVDDLSDSFIDSIGARHNRLMVNMEKYDRKYISLNLLDRKVQNQFYSDFVREMKALYPEFEGMELSESDRDDMISKVIDLLEIAQQDIDKSNYYNLFMNDIYKLFTQKYKISKEDAQILKYTSNLSLQCDKLDNESLERYAEDLNKVIDSSSLEVNQKKAIVSVSQISINSSLCWKD